MIKTQGSKRYNNKNTKLFTFFKIHWKRKIPLENQGIEDMVLYRFFLPSLILNGSTLALGIMYFFLMNYEVQVSLNHLFSYQSHL